MNIDTHYFGSVTYEECDIVHFSDGLFGFTELKEYLPLAFNEGSDSMICLQSLGDPDVSFILMNPFMLDPNYSPGISPEDRAALDVQNEEDLSFYVICVMRDVPEESTINFKSPIVVNSKNREGRQIILEHPSYTFRHPMKEFLRNDKEV